METQPKIITRDDGSKVLRIFSSEDMSLESISDKISNFSGQINESNKIIDEQTKSISALQSQIDFYQNYLKQITPTPEVALDSVNSTDVSPADVQVSM